MRIAFTTGRNGPFEIWSASGPSTTATRLLAGPPGSIEVDPAWDPDATGEFAFARRAADDETYDLLVKPASTPAVKLTEDVGGTRNSSGVQISGGSYPAARHTASICGRSITLAMCVQFHVSR